MKYVLFLFSVLLSLNLLEAQDYGCGLDIRNMSETERQAALTFYTQARPPLAKTNAIDSVAVTVHVIETVAGAPNITYAQLESDIEKMNTIFRSVGVVFFICGSPRYIQGERLYTPTLSDPLHARQGVPNTVNIYYAEELQGSSGSEACGYAYLPYGREISSRYIMMRKSCANDNGTLTHEMGHFYGLYHTHDTPFAKEYVDGSNCTRGGDLICDTGADPDLSRPGMMRGCTYVGEVRDPKGLLYKPPVSNFMSYASSTCYRSFSAGQMDVMRAIHAEDNAGLASRCDFYPDFAISTPTKTINIRSDQDVTLEYAFENVGIDKAYEVSLNVAIAKTPEEDGFILLKEKVTINPSQNRFSQTFDIDFPIDRGTGTYYLKAFLDAEYEIIERTESNNFALTTVTVDNSNLTDVVLFPNPVQDELKLFFRDKKAEGRMFIRVYRYDGRLILEDEVFKNGEEFFKVLDVSWLSTGLYVIAVDFEKVNVEYSFKFLKQ